MLWQGVVLLSHKDTAESRLFQLKFVDKLLNMLHESSNCGAGQKTSRWRY